jgi:hypothetical protein
MAETVTVEGIRARTGVAWIHAQSIKTADGRKVFIGDYHWQDRAAQNRKRRVP